MTTTVIREDQMRSVDYIIVNFKALAIAAVVALTLAILSLVLAAIVPSMFAGSGALELVAAGSLGSVIVIGLLLMLSTSYIVVKNRKQLLDWGLFLAVIWLLPYLGISIYLGGTALVRILRSNP